MQSCARSKVKDAMWNEMTADTDKAAAGLAERLEGLESEGKAWKAVLALNLP